MSETQGFEIKKIEPAFTDERGSIYDLIEEQVGHVGLITSNAGSVRANHYHLESTQYTYVLSVEIELTISDIDGSNEQVHTMTEGTYVKIPPKVVHVYKAIADSTFLDCTTLSRTDNGYEEDTVRMS